MKSKKLIFKHGFMELELVESEAEVVMFRRISKSEHFNDTYIVGYGPKFDNENVSWCFGFYDMTKVSAKRKFDQLAMK